MSEQRKYVALIAGGYGEDTWDRELEFHAPNLVTAAALAHAAAVEAGAGADALSVEEVD